MHLYLLTAVLVRLTNAKKYVYEQGATNGDCHLRSGKSVNCNEDYDFLPSIVQNNPDYCLVYGRVQWGNCDRFCYNRGMQCIAAYSSRKRIREPDQCYFTEDNIGGCTLNGPQQGFTSKWRKWRLCLCGPYVDNDEIDCVYSPRREGKGCASYGDPHIKGFEFRTSADKYDYMGTGTYNLYKSANGYLTLQARIVEHPWRTRVSTNMAMAFTGTFTCGRTYEIHAASYDKSLFTRGALDWDDWPHAFVLDGAVVTAEQWSAALGECDMVCDHKVTEGDSETQENVIMNLAEGTQIRLSFFVKLKFGMTANIYVPFKVYDEANDSGQCFIESVPIDACDEENIFQYFKDGTTCEDFQDDPDRETDIGDPCDDADPDLVAEGLALCEASCPEDVIPTCLFDICIAEDLSGAQEVADTCNFDEQNPIEEEEYDGVTEEPTPAPTPTPTPAPTLSPTPAPTSTFKCPIPMGWMEGIPFGNDGIRRLQEEEIPDSEDLADGENSELVTTKAGFKSLMERYTRKRDCGHQHDYVPEILRSTKQVCAVYVRLHENDCNWFCSELGYECVNSVPSQHTDQSGKDPCIQDPNGTPEGCDVVESELSAYQGNWKESYRICVCGRGPIDCEYKLNQFNWGYNCNTFGDPHVQGFRQYMPEDEEGEPILVSESKEQGEYVLYKSETYVEVQVRQMMHPWWQWNPLVLDSDGDYKSAAGNFGVAFLGSGDMGFTCGDTYELHGGSPSKQSFIKRGKCTDETPCDWGDYGPAFIKNGVEVTKEAWTADLEACDNVCSVEDITNENDVAGIELRFLEGTKIRINKYFGDREEWGMDLRIWVESQLLDEVNDSGMCFADNDSKLPTCSENSLFSFYREGQSCNDF